MLLWTVGFVLLFALKGSPWIWLSDTFLLLGFWPLLFVWKAGWPWIVFGTLNVVISFLLELTQQITVDMMGGRLPPPLMATFLEGQKHLGENHGFVPWFIIGILSALFGLFRVCRTIFRFLHKRYKMNEKHD